MKISEMPTQSYLRKILSYDCTTGLLFWLPRVPSMFSAPKKRSPEHRCNNWNSVYAGKEAFTAYTTGGYLVGSVDDTLYKAHRIIWKRENGGLGGLQVDHINGITSDNRTCNLRLVTSLENSQNCKLSEANTSGTPGVHFAKDRGRWQATIQISWKVKFLGYFSKKEDAVAARKSAEIEYGFHQNHGRTQ